jgi:predicted transcriptional regulator
MLIAEILDVGIAECTEDTSLRDVYELIQRSAHGYVVVIDSLQHRVPIGIVNEHSICENMIRRDRAAKSLDAGAVINTNVKRVSANVEITECEGLLDEKADAILVVNERRQFLGILEPERLERLVTGAREHFHTPTIFTSIGGQHVPAAVEIPAFGWLK